MRKWMFASGITFVIILVLSLFLAFSVTSKIGFEFRQKPLPSLLKPEAKKEFKKTPSFPSLDAVLLPPLQKGASPTSRELFLEAARDLKNAVKTRTGKELKIATLSEEISQGNTLVVISEKEARLLAGKNKNFRALPSSFTDQSFAIQPLEEKKGIHLYLTGGSPLAQAQGIYWVAERYRGHKHLEELFKIPFHFTPRLKLRMVEQGGVGLNTEEKTWGRDYSLHNREYEHVFLEEAPFLREEEFKKVERDFKKYVHHIIKMGYNAVIMVGLLEFINFDKVDDGYQIYSEDSIYRKRHLVFWKRFGALFNYAHQMGLKVFLRSDMVPVTRPLEEFFHSRFGGFPTEDPSFWKVWDKAFAELFEKMPYLDGVMIRIGEAGSMYNLSHWDYRSELYVRTVKSTQAMIKGLLPSFQQADKTLIFRTWSVGVGEIGELHTNPEVYRKVLDPLPASDHLIISTKYCKGDYFRFLQLNPTLEKGKHQRMVEFQTRREYEGFSGYANYVAPLHQVALQHFLEKNPHVMSMWVWPQYGGPLQKSPMTAYPLQGLWMWIDANTYATSQLGWNPYLDISETTDTWISARFSSHRQVRKNLAETLFLSDEAIRQGLYIEKFAQKELLSFGIETPPMVWIFQWSWVTGSPSALTAVYEGSKEEWLKMGQEGFLALEKVRRMHKKTLAAKDRVKRNKDQYQKMIDSLAFQESLFEALAWYRPTFLSYYRYLEKGDEKAFEKYEKAREQFLQYQKKFAEEYRGDHRYAAYRFVEAKEWLERAKNNDFARLMARILFSLFLLLFGAGITGLLTEKLISDKVVKALALGLVAPWRLEEMKINKLHGFILFLLVFFSWTASIFVATSLYAPKTTIFIAGLTLAAILIFTFLFTRDQSQLVAPHLMAAHSPLVLLSAWILFPSLLRGPDHGWYLFWSSTTFRAVFIAGAMVIGLWLIFTLICTLATRGKESPSTIVARFLLVLGTLLALTGGIVGVIGLKEALIGLNRELLLLPFAALEILDFVTHFGLNLFLPWLICLAGFLCAAFALIFMAFDRAREGVKRFVFFLSE